MNTQISPSDLNLNVANPASSTDRTVGFRDFLPFLHASWLIIALCLVVFVGGALLYILNTPPSYVAKAQLMTRTYGDETQDHQLTVADDAVIESQIEVIKSDDVLRTAITKLSLLNDPELARQPPSFASMLRSWLATASPSDLQAMLAFNPQQSEMTFEEKERFLLAVLRGRLWVRQVGRSSVVDIAFNSSDAEKAATIANTIAESFMAKDVESKARAATEATDWLAGRLSELREQVFASDRAAELFKAQGDGAQTPGGQFKLKELVSVADTYRKVYEGFLQRWAETKQRISYPVSDARFVTRATAPLSKSEPKSAIIVAFAALLGLAAGIASASIRGSMRRSISYALDTAKVTDLPCLGMISTAHANSSPIPLVSTRRTEGMGKKRKRGAARSGNDLLHDFRDLKATLTGLFSRQKINVIGIVGVHEGAGATTAAANLAFMHSASGSRTLLIDTCAHNPTISRNFAPDSAISLHELLQTADPYTALTKEKHASLVVVPVGPFEGGVSPGDRLSSCRATLSLSELKRFFDVILVDLPALNGTADARAIAPLLDAVVVIVRAGETTLDELDTALHGLQSVGARVAGIVLNSAKGRDARGNGRAVK
jgi:polysaccharide biosynthesis transport protein